MRSPCEIVVFRESCYPFSETFIWGQAARLSGARVVGLHRVHDLAPLPDDLVLSDSHPRLATPEAKLLKLSRRSPWLRRALIELRPRTLLAHSTYEAWSLLPTVRRLGIPLVVAVHGSDITREPASVPRSHFSLRRANAEFDDLTRNVRTFLPASEFLADVLRQRGVPDAKILPHYVGVPIPEPSEPVSRPPRVSFVGRLAPGKGLFTLIAAFALLAERHPAAELAIIGDGPLARQLEQEIGRAGLRGRAVLLGRKAPAQVRDLMQKSAVVAVPSEVRSDGVAEGLGQVALEAQSLSTPVVVTAVGGLGETVAPDSGIIIPPGDASALGFALDELLSDPVKVSELGLLARSWVVRNFDIDRQTQRLEELLGAAA